MKRDLYIDVVKGLATLSVISGHTIFWSGELYVPAQLKYINLAFEIPVFFLLSGLTSSGKIEKNIHRLLKLQITYMLFISVIFIICYLTWRQVKWGDLFNWYIHNYSESQPLPVVLGSMWYMKVYFVVAFIGTIVLRYLSNKQITILTCLLLGGILFFSFYPPLPTENPGYTLAYLPVYIFFYLFIFLLAQRCRNILIKAPYIFLILTGLVFLYYLLFLYFGYKVFEIQEQKFPPSIIYLAYASFSLLLVLSLKGRLKFTKPNFLSYIGQNAIFYYFAQGIGSSLLYFLVYKLKDSFSWYCLLPVMLIVNLSLTIVLAEVIKKGDALAWKALHKLKDITT